VTVFDLAELFDYFEEFWMKIVSGVLLLFWAYTFSVAFSMFWSNFEEKWCHSWEFFWSELQSAIQGIQSKIFFPIKKNSTFSLAGFTSFLKSAFLGLWRKWRQWWLARLVGSPGYFGYFNYFGSGVPLPMFGGYGWSVRGQSGQLLDWGFSEGTWWGNLIWRLFLKNLMGNLEMKNIAANLG
jgi:hypothetical protein